MSESWNHHIRRHDGVQFLHCSVGKCSAAARYLTAHNYVTGRAGRVSTQHRQLCPTHAANYCLKNHLTLPPAADIEVEVVPMAQYPVYQGDL